MAGPENQSRSYVRLTGPAVQDLRRLLAKDPQIVRAALKKMLLLERNPEAGEPLLGSLVGWRNLPPIRLTLLPNGKSADRVPNLHRPALLTVWN